MVKIRQQVMFDEEIFSQMCKLRDEMKYKNLSQTINWYFAYSLDEVSKKNAQLIRKDYKLDELNKELEELKNGI